MTFIRWIGGKNILSKKIYSLVEDLDTSELDYYEPFLGSGIVLVKMLERNKFRNYYCSDINAYLINAHRCVRDNCEELIDWLTLLNKDLTKETYYERRKLFNVLKKQDMFTPFMAALFIYLNKTCYRGMYGENLKGEMNIPYGYINRRIFVPEKIRKISKLYREHNVNFSVADYRAYRYIEGSFFYLDPPYVGTFDKYTKEGFSTSEFTDFLSEVEKNNHVILSNSADFQFHQELYQVQSVTLKDNVNRQESHRKEILASSVSLLLLRGFHSSSSSDYAS